VTVHHAELLWRDGERAGIELECSAGTYVRQLVAGLGDAYCEELERTRIGPFRLEDADEERIVPLGEALAFLPERRLDPGDARRVAHGRAPAEPGAVEASGHAELSADAAQEGAVVRLTSDGRLVAIAEPCDERLRPVVVFGP
jgi:tRNA pseudouridine55 synthase